MEQSVSIKNTDILSEINHTPSYYELAYKDLRSAIKKWKLWVFLGSNDIKMRYRGSVLGPIWITASMLIFIGAFSLVYSRLFHQSLDTYVPFLTAGYLVWILISSVLIESCNIFVDAAPFITEIKLPYTMYLFRLSWRHILIFAHNAVVFLIVAIIFKVPVNWTLLFIIPGLILLVLNLISISLLLAMFGTKYRDIPQAVASLIQVAFFVTPVSWSPSLLNNSVIIRYNPLTYFIDLIRSPLLGQAPTELSWIVSLGLTLFIFGIAFTLFAKYRRNIPFWL